MLSKLIISGFVGLFYGVLGYAALALAEVPDAPRLALVAGLSAFGLLLLYQQLHENRMVRRYEQAEKLLPGQPLDMMDVNVREDRKVSSARLYLYTGELCLLCVEKREPVLTRIPLDDVLKATMDPPVELRLDLANGRTLLFLSTRMEDLVRHLRCMGCPVTQLYK